MKSQILFFILALSTKNATARSILISKDRSLNIMFKVGEYDEDEAKSVTGFLRDAGFKVDIKGLVRARNDRTASLQGKLSEIEGKVETFEQCQRFLSALRTAIEKGATEETFRDLFLDEVNPNWKDNMEKIRENNDSPEDLDEEALRDITRSVAECIVAMDFADNVLEINGINFGEPINGLLDDPIVSVPVNPDDYDTDDPMLRRRLDVDLVKMHEILIDEFYAPLFRDVDEDFQDEYFDEYVKIRALGILIEDLMDEPETGEMDIEEFADMCMVDLGDWDVISIDASLVAEEIARSLEKNGIIKMKGDTIKWKA
jgi:hypothetical protein